MQALATFVNSLCKLFEKPNRKKHLNPNFSIPTALAQFRKNISNVSVPHGNGILLGEYICNEIDSGFDIFDPIKALAIPDILYSYFEQECPQAPPRSSNKMDMSFDALKVLRDKRIDHHEDCDLKGLSTTDFDGAIELLCFAQTFVNIIGYKLFGSSQNTVVLAEEFLPDRSGSGRQIKKLIQKLENGFSPSI